MITELGAELHDLAEDQAEWSQRTFGADAERGPLGALRHLEQEAREAQAAVRAVNECRANGRADNPLAVGTSPPWSLSAVESELADCLLLVLDAARRAGLGPLALVRVARRKMETNRARAWPKPTPDEPVGHVRDGGG
jgi:NTP pyrophosphatase (non-canonical NTP hydrolase)